MSDAKTALKGKRLTIDTHGETIVIEGDKLDLQAINKRLEDFSRAVSIVGQGLEPVTMIDQIRTT